MWVSLIDTVVESALGVVLNAVVVIVVLNAVVVIGVVLNALVVIRIVHVIRAGFVIMID